MRKLLLRKSVFYMITFLVVLVVTEILIAPFYKIHANFWSHSISIFAIFVLAISYAIIKKGTKNAMIFFALSAAISFAAEAIGVNYGYTFGSSYAYSDSLGPKILGVPLLVILMWETLIFVVYAVSEHILDFRITRNVSRKDKFYLVLSGSIVAALMAVAWDFVLDPLAIIYKWWAWQDTGYYFGIPSSNFIGWFVVVFLTVFIFKIFFEYEYLERETKYDYAPALLYTLLYFSIINLALETKQYVFILIGFVTMGSFISIMIARYLATKAKVPHLYMHEHKSN